MDTNSLWLWCHLITKLFRVVISRYFSTCTVHTNLFSLAGTAGQVHKWDTTAASGGVQGPYGLQLTWRHTHTHIITHFTLYVCMYLAVRSVRLWHMYNYYTIISNVYAKYNICSIAHSIYRIIVSQIWSWILRLAIVELLDMIGWASNWYIALQYTQWWSCTDYVHAHLFMYVHMQLCMCTHNIVCDMW